MPCLLVREEAHCVAMGKKIGHNHSRKLDDNATEGGESYGGK